MGKRGKVTLSIDALAILAKYYPVDSEAHEIIVVHSVLVAQKALSIAHWYSKVEPDAELDLEFIREAALLHDIGIRECDAPEIGCHGSEPYLMHGVLGRKTLEKEGLPKHALVCERHTGSGLTAEEIENKGLPLPARDLCPVSLEEKIICVADKFYGKSSGRLWQERKVAKIDRKFEKWGKKSQKRWNALKREFLDLE